MPVSPVSSFSSRCAAGAWAGDGLTVVHSEKPVKYVRARKAIDRAAAGDAGWGIAAASVTEFWAIATHPASEGRSSTPGQATAFVRALVHAGAEIWLPGPGFGDRLPGLRLHDPL